MSGATPGPWIICGANRGGCVCGLVFSEKGDVAVADTALDSDPEIMRMRPEGAERKANARLIAAAPDLLDVVEELLLEIDRAAPYVNDVMQKIPCDSIARARAAIAKATQP